MYLQGYCGPAHSQGQYTTCIENERKCSLRMSPTAYSGHLSEGEKGQMGRCNTHNICTRERWIGRVVTVVYTHIWKVWTVRETNICIDVEEEIVLRALKVFCCAATSSQCYICNTKVRLWEEFKVCSLTPMYLIGWAWPIKSLAHSTLITINTFHVFNAYKTLGQGINRKAVVGLDGRGWGGMRCGL